MARSDLLKKLLKGAKANDQVAIREATLEIIEDERKKNHASLAEDLSRILSNGQAREHAPHTFESLPKDADRGSALVEVRRTDLRLADLVHSDQQRETIGELVDEYRHWEVLETNGLVPRTKLLFCGPPGCGKTATSSAIANELGLPLLYVNFDAVVSSLLGETAANLRKVFDYAARGSWVLLFDEFDAVGRSRDDATEHGELKRVVNAFLQMLDRFGGRSLVIAATNFEQSLDPALWRRFDEIVRYELPDRAQIRLHLHKLLARTGSLLADDSIVERLVGSAYSDVERICNDAMRRVILSGRKNLERSDLDRAVIRHERRKQALARSRGRDRPAVDEG